MRILNLSGNRLFKNNFWLIINWRMENPSGRGVIRDKSLK